MSSTDPPPTIKPHNLGGYTVEVPGVGGHGRVWKGRRHWAGWIYGPDGACLGRAGLHDTLRDAVAAVADSLTRNGEQP
jgi:hypothetical protein